MNILNFYTYKQYSVLTTVMIIFALIALIVFGYIAVKLPFFTRLNNQIALGTCAGVLIISLVIGLIIVQPKKHIVYEATIEDDYSANSLYNEFVVKDKRGSIYILERREK